MRILKFHYMHKLCGVAHTRKVVLCMEGILCETMSTSIVQILVLFSRTIQIESLTVLIAGALILVLVIALSFVQLFDRLCCLLH